MPQEPLTEGSAALNFAIEERLETASTLPSWCYTNPGVIPLEQAKVFSRTWQLVGREDQATQPGDYFTATVGEEPLLIVRGSDRRVRALSNVCRHRAGPVAKGEGNCRAFRCGYHGWSYSLEGSLVNTPEFEGVENFEKEANSLPEFSVETWLGLLFVNLDPEARPLREVLEGLPGELESRGFASFRLAARKEWTLDCNWKVYVDNYLEGYHIPVVHPGLMKEIDYASYVTETKSFFSLQHSPIREAPASRLRRDERTGESEARYYWIFPNLMFNAYPDNYSTNLVLPLGHERTLTIFEWYFRDPDRPETQETVRKTIEFSDEIQREDIAVCEAVQRGLRSRTYETGRYCLRRESGVHHFHRLLVRFLREVGLGYDAQ